MTSLRIKEEYASTLRLAGLTTLKHWGLRRIERSGGGNLDPMLECARRVAPGATRAAASRVKASEITTFFPYYFFALTGELSWHI
jgi:hypothetical protein